MRTVRNLIDDAIPVELLAGMDEEMNEHLRQVYESLADLDSDTQCGKDCAFLIRMAQNMLHRLSDAEQDDEFFTEELWRQVIWTCGVYWEG